MVRLKFQTVTNSSSEFNSRIKNAETMRPATSGYLLSFVNRAMCICQIRKTDAKSSQQFNALNGLARSKAKVQ